MNALGDHVAVPAMGRRLDPRLNRDRGRVNGQKIQVPDHFVICLMVFMSSGRA